MALAHEVLGVRPGANPDEVRAAFRRFARLHHPDRGGDAPKFRAGVEAYRRLLGLAGPSSGSPEVVFYRRPRGLE
ncbi:MAG: J domain-containing protein, partial [Actinomycetota bacterium]|nr:J domain-containing protein [Actinomycetota bacterium]